MTDMKKRIAELIRKTRVSKNMRAVDLAEKMNISTATISKIENGKTGEQTSVKRNIRNIFDELEIDVEKDEEICKYLKTVQYIDGPSRRNDITQQAAKFKSPLIGNVSRFSIEVKTFISEDSRENNNDIDRQYETEHKAISEAMYEYFVGNERLKELQYIVEKKIDKMNNEKKRVNENLQRVGWQMNK